MEQAKQFTTSQYVQRDNRESKVATFERQAEVSDDLYQIAKKRFKAEKKKYIEWRESLGIPGIKY